MTVQESKYSAEQLDSFEKWYKQVSKKIEVADVAGPIHIGPPREEDTPRFPPAVWPVPPENREGLLVKYRDLALSLGAADAKIVLAKEIPLDVRALYVTCTMPSCRWLNTNTNCPLQRKFVFEDMQEFFGDYTHALAFKVLAPKFEGVPDVGEINLDRLYTLGGGAPPDKAMLARNIIRLRILGEMTRRIRQVAFYDGYMMAAPVYPSPCLVYKCADLGKCPALEKGGYCRFEDTSPAGATAYIDYATLSRRLGWGKMQVGGNCAFPENAPSPEGYYNMGLVLID